MDRCIILSGVSRPQRKCFCKNMKFTLQKNIWLGLFGVLLLAVLSSGMALVTARRGEDVYRNLIMWNEEQARVIYEVQIAWLEQRSAISFYLIDGDTRWIDDLVKKKADFETWLKKLEGTGLETDQQKLASEIRGRFNEYESKMNSVINLAGGGVSEEARRLWLIQTSTGYYGIYDLCERLTEANNRDIAKAIDIRRTQIDRANFWVTVFLILLILLVVVLSSILRRGLFQPIRRLWFTAARDYGIEDPQSTSGQIRSLGVYIDHLKDEVGGIRSRLSLSQKQLLDAEKLASIGRLAASLAHEIRSPLTALRLRLFTVQKVFDKNRRQRDFELITEEITRLDNIVSDFLEFSHTRKLSLRECNISALISATVELLDYKLKAANVKVEYDQPHDIPTVSADQQQLRQVLINVLNNAIEALPDGGTVRITTRREANEERSGEHIQILIADNGPGIPEKVRDRVFEPFFGTKKEGAGLGLWISKRIMSEHGGGLEIIEAGQEGSIFALWLPLTPGGHNE